MKGHAICRVKQIVAKIVSLLIEDFKLGPIMRVVDVVKGTGWML